MRLDSASARTNQATIMIDGLDLSIVLGAWGSPGATDIDGSGSTDGGDLSMLLGSWSS